MLEIEGLNKDGKTVVKDVKDYQGKDCRTVVNELVREIYDDGYSEKRWTDTPRTSFRSWRKAPSM